MSGLGLAEFDTRMCASLMLSFSNNNITTSDTWNSFNIEPRDQYQNPIPYSSQIALLAPTEPVFGPFSIGGYFDVAITPGSSTYISASKWSHNKDGTYTVSYRVVQSQDEGEDPLTHVLNDRAYPRAASISVSYQSSLASANTAQQSSVKRSYQYNDGATIFGLACGVLGMSMALGYSASVLYYWQHDIMKFSQKRFLRRVCAGIALLFACVIVSYFPPSVAVCGINRWGQHIGFVLVMGALAVKTWRVKVIAENDMKKLKVSDQKLLMSLRLLLLVTIIYLSLWTYFDPPRAQEVVTSREHENNGITSVEYVADVCDVGYRGFQAFLFILERLLLIYAGVIAYQTRFVPLVAPLPS